MKKRGIAICLVITLVMAFTHFTGLALVQGPKNNVLILHSYHRGYPWTDSIHDGIMENLAVTESDGIYVEYLDALRNRSDDYLDHMAEIYEIKYDQIDLDLILVSDDNALAFLRDRPALFMETPVVFCGINNYQPQHYPMENATGVNEEISALETVEAALQLRPNARKMGVIAGSALTEQRNLEIFQEAISQLDSFVAIHYHDRLEPEELKEALQAYTAEDVLIGLGYMATPSGKSFSVEEFVVFLVENSEAPIFGYWDFLLPYGVVGGRVVHGYSQGEMAASLANQLLGGMAVSDLPVIMESPNVFMFNEMKLERYGIELKSLPPKALVVNRTPQSLLENWGTVAKNTFFGYDMFENHGQLMWLVEPATGLILDANETAIAHYGYPRLIGMTVAEINVMTPEEMQQEIDRAVRQDNNYFQFRHQLGDGRVIDVEVHSYPIEVAGQQVLFSVMNDITDKLAAQQQVVDLNRRTLHLTLLGLAVMTVLAAALAFSRHRHKLLKKEITAEKERFESLTENSFDIIMVISPEGMVLYSSRAAELILGVSQRQLEGENLFQRVHPHDHQALQNLLFQVNPQKADQASAVFRMKHQEGRWVWLESRGQNRTVDPDLEGLLLNCRDVTKRIEAEARQLEYNEKLIEAKEEAEAANRTKNQFLSNMSHELRTPLNGLFGMLQLLESSNLTDEQQEYIHLAKSGSQSLTRVVEDILNYTSLEKGAQRIREASFLLEDLLQEIVALHQTTALHKGLSLSSHQEENLPSGLVGDRFKLKQILGNLVGNAVKFTEVGAVHLSVRGETADTRSGRIRVIFQVKDTGIGIPPEKLEYIFQQFTQEDESHTRQYGGLGLGLAAAREQAAMLGGHLTADSTPGKGSVFTFTCEMGLGEEVKPPAVNRKPKNSYLQGMDSGTFRILVVDDDYASRVLAKIHLEKMGFQAETASNGEDALEKAADGRYHLILMDCQMPVMNGFEATRCIREREKGTGRHTPIVAMTAKVLPGDREQCLEAGMDGFLAKPFERERLAVLVNEYVDKK